MKKSKKLEGINYIKLKKPIDKKFLLNLNKNLTQWYKDVKGLSDEIGLIKFHNEFQECPNCKGDMICYEINSLKPEDLWYVCSNCNYIYQEKHQDFFATLISHAIKETEIDIKR